MTRARAITVINELMILLEQSITESECGDKDAIEAEQDNKDCLEALKQAAEDIVVARCYEDTGLTPEQIMELKERDTAKAIVHDCTRDINGIIVFHSKLCPNCGRSCSDDYDDYNFCPDCGQRLKWEEA